MKFTAVGKVQVKVVGASIEEAVEKYRSTHRCLPTHVDDENDNVLELMGRCESCSKLLFDNYQEEPQEDYVRGADGEMFCTSCASSRPLRAV